MNGFHLLLEISGLLFGFNKSIFIYPFLLGANFLVVLGEEMGLYDSYLEKTFTFYLTETTDDDKRYTLKHIKTINVLNESVSFKEIMLSKEMIFFSLILMFGIGTTVSNMNNIPFIIKSISIVVKTKEYINYTKVYFLMIACVKYFSGSVIEWLLINNYFYYYLFSASVCGALSQFLGIFMEKNILFLTLGLAGCTQGAFVISLPMFCKYQFGSTHLGKTLGTAKTACAIGILAISEFVFPMFYNDNFNMPGGCFGKECFYPAFILTTAFLIFCSMLAYTLEKMRDAN